MLACRGSLIPELLRQPFCLATSFIRLSAFGVPFAFATLPRNVSVAFPEPRAIGLIPFWSPKGFRLALFSFSFRLREGQQRYEEFIFLKNALHGYVQGQLTISVCPNVLALLCKLSERQLVRPEDLARKPCDILAAQV